VDSQFVDTRWPEPDTQIHRVVAGDSAFSLAHQYYEQDARLIQSRASTSGSSSPCWPT